VAYLLCRLLDTIEDAAHWTRERGLFALAELRDLVGASSDARASRLSRKLCGERVSLDPGYQRLVLALPRVLAEYRVLPSEARGIVSAAVVRMADGMARFVSRFDAAGQLWLRDLADLRQYCYAVAGIAGELLTELFLADTAALAAVADHLRQRAPVFGEGLQLVNILRDAEADARDGRHYLTPETPPERIAALAHRDLDAAAAYVRILREGGAAPGVVAFTALPLQLARETVECVVRRGPGAKLSRARVAAIQAEVRLTARPEADRG